MRATTSAANHVSLFFNVSAGLQVFSNAVIGFHLFHGCYHDHHASLAPRFYSHQGSSAFVFSFALIRAPAASLSECVFGMLWGWRKLSVIVGIPFSQTGFSRHASSRPRFLDASGRSFFNSPVSRTVPSLWRQTFPSISYDRQSLCICS